jgi:ABC-type dipeptide/oligopeptide/nickel transport system ATPase component
MSILELPNDKLVIQNSKNNLDKILDKSIPTPLPNYSGFCMVIAGSSGSGKTTFLYSIMTKNKKNGVRQSYKKVFNNIYVISPTIGNGSMKNDPFDKLAEDKKHKALTADLLNELEEKLEDNKKNDKHSLIIFDDVGSQLRKSAQVEKKLVQLVQNRRHLYCSMIFLVQRFRDIPTGVRNNLSHLITFKPKNRMEREAIVRELFTFDAKTSEKLMDYVFENKDQYSFLFVDMSQKSSIVLKLNKLILITKN